MRVTVHDKRQKIDFMWFLPRPPSHRKKLLSLIRISHRDVTPRELLFLFGESTDCFTQRNSKFHCWNVTQTHTKVMNSRRSINLHRKSPPRSSLVLAAQEEFLLIFKSSPLLLWLRQDRVNISSAGYAQRREKKKSWREESEANDDVTQQLLALGGRCLARPLLLYVCTLENSSRQR